MGFLNNIKLSRYPKYLPIRAYEGLVVFVTPWQTNQGQWRKVIFHKIHHYKTPFFKLNMTLYIQPFDAKLERGYPSPHSLKCLFGECLLFLGKMFCATFWLYADISYSMLYVCILFLFSNKYMLWEECKPWFYIKSSFSKKHGSVCYCFHFRRFVNFYLKRPIFGIRTQNFQL